MKKIAKMLLLLIFFLLFLYQQYFLLLLQTTFGHSILQLLLCIFFLFGRFKSFKVSSDWIRQLEQK